MQIFVFPFVSELMSPLMFALNSHLNQLNGRIGEQGILEKLKGYIFWKRQICEKYIFWSVSRIK